MRTVINLINSDKDRKLGNHRLEISSNNIRRYYYHSTAIIVQYNRTVEVDDGGWNTSSTKRAINCYLKNLDYATLLDKRGALLDRRV